MIVTTKRIEDALLSLGLHSDTDDGDVTVTLPGVSITFQLSTNNAVLRMFAQWRGRTQEASISQQICEAILDFNTDSYMPKLTWRITDQGIMWVAAEQIAIVDQGLNDDQLSRFLDLVLRTTLHAFADLELQLPQLRDWDSSTEVELNDWRPKEFSAAPVSFARVLSVFQANNWAYQLQEETILASSGGFCVDIDFPNEHFLGVRVSHPEVELEPEKYHLLVQWANQRNINSTLGTCSTSLNDDGTFYVASDFVSVIDAGATDEQLAEWILAGITMQVGNLEDFARQFAVAPPV